MAHQVAAAVAVVAPVAEAAQVDMGAAAETKAVAEAAGTKGAVAPAVVALADQAVAKAVAAATTISTTTFRFDVKGGLALLQRCQSFSQGTARCIVAAEARGFPRFVGMRPFRVGIDC